MSIAHALVASHKCQIFECRLDSNNSKIKSIVPSGESSINKSRKFFSISLTYLSSPFLEFWPDFCHFLTVSIGTHSPNKVLGMQRSPSIIKSKIPKKSHFFKPTTPLIVTFRLKTTSHPLLISDDRVNDFLLLNPPRYHHPCLSLSLTKFSHHVVSTNAGERKVLNYVNRS